MFRGRYVHTIDAKNRMSLPMAFRQALERSSDRPPILTNAYDCLELHCFEDWEAFEERIVAIADVDPEAQAYARMMISGATECPIDKQGRILVPPHLRAYAALEREVTLAGCGRKIEIWDNARFEAKFNETHARFEQMAISVAGKLRN